MVLEDRRLTERDVAEALDISLGSVSHVLREVLGFRNLCAQWVPHSLTMEQKHVRMRLSEQHLERFRKDKKDFSPVSISFLGCKRDFVGGLSPNWQNNKF